ncbi:MAG: 30S ribosomal protein S16 [Minisyncoccia bacterium]
MLKIRLLRVGRVHEPSFRLVLTDSKNSTKSGKSIETLGNFDARHAETSTFKADRITYWMSKGAQVSPTVNNLLVTKKIIKGKKINNLPLKKAIVKDAPAEEGGGKVAKEEVPKAPVDGAKGKKS